MEADPLHADMMAALTGGQPADFWARHSGPTAVRADNASLEVEINLPLPAPLGSSAASLELIDRVYRLAVQAVETGEPLERLWDTGADGIPVPYGLRLETVEGGSAVFTASPSDRLYQALQSKPVVFTLAFISGLNLAGYDVQIDRDEPAPAAPAAAPAVEQVPGARLQEPGIKGVMTVNGRRYVVRGRPLLPVDARRSGAATSAPN